MDSTAAKRLNNGDAVVVLVVTYQVVISGDQRSQVLEEGDVSRRQIVQRANGHVQQVVSGLGRFICKTCHQVRVDRTGLPYSGALSGDSNQVCGACAVDRQVGVEDGRHEDCAPTVRGREGVVEARVWDLSGPNVSVDAA